MVYNPAENLDFRGKPIPFRYKPDRVTVRAAKRMLRKEEKKNKDESPSSVRIFGDSTEGI